MRGFWADERVEGGLWNLKKPVFKAVYRFFKKKEKQFIQESDAIISLTHAGKREMLSWNLGVPEDKITVIPCCADFALFDYEKVDLHNAEIIKEKLEIPSSSFVLGYLGSIGTWYMLDEMLTFFKMLSKKIKNALFLFVTTDPPAQILEMAAQKGIDTKKIFIAPARREDVPAYITLFDYSIFLIKPCYSKQASSPTKLAEIMGMGKPIICNTGVGDIDTIFSDNTMGIAVDVYQQKRWEQIIKSLPLQNDKKLQLRRKLKGKSLFGLDIGSRQYIHIYRSLIERE